MYASMTMFSQLTARPIGPGRFPEEVTMRKHHSFCPTALSPLEDRVVLSHGRDCAGGSRPADPTVGAPCVVARASTQWNNFGYLRHDG